MAKKKNKSTELHPMLLKGIVIGLGFGLVYMVYVNMLQNRYESTQSAVQGLYDSAVK